MKQIPNCVYTPEYRAEAVKLVLDSSLKVVEAAKKLGMPKQTLATWVALAKEGKLKNLDVSRSKETGDLEAENARLRKELAVSALELPIKIKRPGPGLVHHSDRGSQYCSFDYQQLLKKHGFISSMSRKGNCYDNAPMESFLGSLKTECVYQCHYKTRQQAQNEIIEYIEIFYNRQRRHSRLGDIAPAIFAMQFWQQKIAA